jgi:hypothetical protein
MYEIPNRVIASATSDPDTAPLIGEATNTDPNSPFSYPSMGNRWITKTLDPSELPDGDTATQQAFLDSQAQQSLNTSSSPQASRQVKHLPVPINIGDVLRFRNTPAGVDSLHVVTSLQLDCTPTGMMQSTLQEVISA